MTSRCRLGKGIRLLLLLFLILFFSLLFFRGAISLLLFLKRPFQMGIVPVFVGVVLFGRRRRWLVRTRCFRVSTGTSIWHSVVLLYRRTLV